ncbi:MAG: TraB/GumN family protein [Candidatus Thermoplasmatota archaeon]|nr:TraB/GumN family protein [Candidatus Thermoplasmatota archaeon]MBS3790253.1 TraB/GumN family protein [Candidatus Thermoplasmatota archaeon]
MITIIGSAHVFDISDRIEKEIKMRRPSVVAVELDRNRYEALKSGQRGGKAPFIYRLLQIVQERIAKKFGVQVGEEMLTAVDTGQKINAKIAFIDLPAQIVLNRLMDEMSLKEKVMLFAGGIVGLFTSKKRIEKEMDRYYSTDDAPEGGFMINIADKMPSISRILIDDRNKFMAKNLIELEKRFGSVLAVVGDGHVPGLRKELRVRELEVVRLKDIQKGEIEEKPNKKTETNTEISFSYDLKNE